MSYYIYKSKPKLIEDKILKNYYEKLKKKYIISPENINKLIDNPIDNPIDKPIDNPINNKWYYKLLLYIWNIIKEYYGFFTIMTLLTILLYVRYIEVNKRKDKIKYLLENTIY